jgi:hypothetical protein
LTIGTKNSDFCLTLGARCVALGLYVMLYGHESCGVLFLKSDSPENLSFLDAIFVGYFILSGFVFDFLLIFFYIYIFTLYFSILFSILL